MRHLNWSERLCRNKRVNRYVNDNFGYITICGYICCLYRPDSLASGSYVSQSTERKTIVRAVSDVLYFGNFYIINIVFAVQLLHISNFQTLVLLTVVLSVLIWSRVNRISLRKLIIKNAEACRKLLQGSMGIKGALYRVWQKFIRMLKYAISFFYREVVCNTLQWILAGGNCCGAFLGLRQTVDPYLWISCIWYSGTS